MILIKTSEEIEKMREGGRKLAKVMTAVLKEIKPGVTTLELDNLAESLIKKAGGQPSFKMVKNYHFTTCICINECVVHGIPTNYKLKDGDVVGIDLGMFYGGFHTDMSDSMRVQSFDSAQDKNLKLKAQSSQIDEFLATGKKALVEAIKQAKIGNHIGDISRTIQSIIEAKSYSVVRELVGHGVGRNLHEEPQIPGFIFGDTKYTPLIKEGMVLAIEVIYNQGKPDVVYKNNDGWSIVTKDGVISGLFEHTIAVTRLGPTILTIN